MTPKIEFFKPSDFRSGHPDKPETYVDAHKAAIIANAKLQKALGPMVSWLKDEPDLKVEGLHYGYDFTAHLFNIQKIEKKECVHEPETITDQYYTWYQREQGEQFQCVKCGVKLKVIFQEVKE